MGLQNNLTDRYDICRKKTEEICAPLRTEDFVVQPSPEVSPPKWHLGHTTWFFEELILSKHAKDYRRHHPLFSELFNSYYNSLGPHWVQAGRGTLSRPTVDEILEYRRKIDLEVKELLQKTNLSPEASFLVELGIHHEQQHQELLFMDIKSIFHRNPIELKYSENILPVAKAPKQEWIPFEEGIHTVGHGEEGFSYDNEKPKHKTYLYPFLLSSAFVTNSEYLEFIEDKGYSKPELWLSLGWDWVQTRSPKHPLYWDKKDGEWFEYTLHGSRPLDHHAPLAHINYFEADAYAHWKNARLPGESEFEVFLGKQKAPMQPNPAFFHPVDANTPRGQLWAWTKSAYGAYPGFRSFRGALQEYNGKFMCNQSVLRGGCFATPETHYRDTYRNFYLPEQQWMFSGIRLAKDLK